MKIDQTASPFHKNVWIPLLEYDFYAYSLQSNVLFLKLQQKHPKFVCVVCLKKRKEKINCTNVSGIKLMAQLTPVLYSC